MAPLDLFDSIDMMTKLSNQYDAIFVVLILQLTHTMKTHVSLKGYTLWMISGHSRPHLQVPSVNR